MLQRFKLRLGDGSVLTVDEDALRAWANDGSATVHVAGTQEWRPLRQFLAEAESAARLALALVPPQPLVPTQPRDEAPAIPEELPASPAAPVKGVERPIVQALAEEPAPVAPALPWNAPEAVGVDAPAIRLKPLDDRPPARTQWWPDVPEARAYQEDRHDRLEGPVLDALVAFGTLLGRCVAPLEPLVRRWPSMLRRASRPRASAPPAPAEDTALAGDNTATAAIPPRSEDRRPWRVRFFAWLRRDHAERGSARDGMTEDVAAADGLHVPIPPKKPATHRAAAVERPAASVPRKPTVAPPPVSELPVLRFAEVREASEVEDVYDGPDIDGGFAGFAPVWRWTKRIVVLAALAAVGTLAAVHWRAWFPRAGEIGRTMFAEIDRQARAGQYAREQEAALADDAGRLPQLAPSTIRRVLSTRKDGVLEPSEVFQLAADAADRGRTALTAAETEELRALQNELRDGLPRGERALVDDYDRARAEGLAFSSDSSRTLELVARGARAMPAERRERLQQLLGKAVTAGLGEPVAPGPHEEPIP